MSHTLCRIDSQYSVTNSRLMVQIVEKSWKLHGHRHFDGEVYLDYPQTECSLHDTKPSVGPIRSMCVVYGRLVCGMIVMLYRA